ncbi:MAG TPA: hypothetical protein VIL28_04575, partial [Steroidobacteraceae bacterium]
LVVVAPDEVQAVLDPLPIRQLRGIGAKTAPHLERMGIVRLRDLRQAPEAALQPIFGRYTAQIRARAAGIDDRPVIPDWDEKQISSEETFDTDLTDRKQMHEQLAELADRTASRLRKQGWVAGLVVLKVRRKDFKTYTRQTIVRPPTHETRQIAAAAATLLNEWLREQPRAAVRLLGVAARDLTQAPQLDLFAMPSSHRNQSLDAAIDNIRAKFGTRAVARASSLRRD